MDGVVNVRKGMGPTSHDVVYAVRKLFGQKRVGHAGTLDPMATGVLVVCLGKATRIVEYLMGAPKEYRARLVLGISTDTQDSTGEVLAEADASGVTREAVEAVIERFIGEIEQIPPMISALKHKGRPLYKLAREGKTVDRVARKINIYSIKPINFLPGEHPEMEIVVECSSGTYIRTLCADIGDALGCGGHMSMLDRTGVGAFTIDDALTVEQLEEAKCDGTLDQYVVDVNYALRDMPGVELSQKDVRDVVHGLVVAVESVGEDGMVVRMLGPGNQFVGIGTLRRDEHDRMSVSPKKILMDVNALEVA